MSNQAGPIAIVGAGLRFPGGVVDLASYWQLLSSGTDAVRRVPADRWDAARWPEVPEHGGFLDDVATFDPDFYRISPREAVELDPAQRLLLDVSWEALENAAIAPDALERSRTGVYVGLGLSDYGRRHFLAADPDRMTPYSGTGSFLSVAAGRISYTLGLEGPAMTVDTACSSSLVSVHLAVQALRRGEVDAALAGGANLLLAPEPSLYFARLEALAPDGRCKTFSAHADGYGRGEGAAMVVLKRLADAVADGDPILAVIRGSAVNQDGRSNGLTAPSGRAQQAVIRAALADAGTDPADVGMIEAHGTGTPLGDPIEMAALRAVLGAPRDDGRTVQVGSVKSNFGHTETAAGIAGILKLALAIHHGEIPPHLHATPINPRIRLDGSALQIPSSPASWPPTPRVGGVSSFGLSGTNAHVVLAQAPERPLHEADRRAVEIITLSAHGAPARIRTAERWGAVAAGQRLADLAHTSHVGRAALRDRVAVTARSPEEASVRLAAYATGEEPTGVVSGAPVGKDPGVAFLFTGQGAQAPGMGRGLYDAEPAFRTALDAALAAVDAHLGRPWPT